MTLHLLLVVLGLALLLGGGDLLVRGASALAKNFGVPPHIIGLTVVAFGTSAPELFVNLLAAYYGNSELSFGNIVGSNIVNIGLIVGLCAVIKPLAIQGVIISREIPMLLLASLVAVILAMDPLLRHSEAIFDRSDGLVFLLLFSVFLYYTAGDVLRQRKTDALLVQSAEIHEKKGFKQRAGNIFLTVSGVVLLVAGGQVVVNSATIVAKYFQVPDVIIGLSIIAIGTSMPELVTSVVATWKGQTDIAIGNVIGSNIFNILFINGLSAVVAPIPVPVKGGLEDIVVMLLFAILLLPIGITDKRKIVRWEGSVLLLCYFGFSIWRVLWL
jgi:cation:H+ antiporter